MEVCSGYSEDTKGKGQSGLHAVVGKSSQNWLLNLTMVNK